MVINNHNATHHQGLEPQSILRACLHGASFRATQSMQLEAAWGMKHCISHSRAHSKVLAVKRAPHTEWTSPCVIVCNKCFSGLIFVFAAQI